MSRAALLAGLGLGLRLWAAEPLSPPPLVPTDLAKTPHPPSIEDRQAAAVSQAALPAEEPPPTAEEPEGVAKVGAGLSYRALYEVPYWGLDLDLYFGRGFEHSGHYFDVLGFYGTSRGGIATGSVRAGYTAEGTVKRVRIGGGPQTALLFLRRATTGNVITLLGVGLRAHATFDVTDPTPGAKVLFVSLNGGGELYVNGSLMFDVGLGFGLRI